MKTEKEIKQEIIRNQSEIDGCFVEGECHTCNKLKDEIKNLEWVLGD